MVIYIYFVTAPYAAPGAEMAMLLFYNGLVEPISHEPSVRSFVLQAEWLRQSPRLGNRPLLPTASA